MTNSETEGACQTAHNELDTLRAPASSSNSGGAAGRDPLGTGQRDDYFDAVRDAPWLAADPRIPRDWYQEPEKTGEQAAGDDSAAEAGRKLANPLSDIWALFTEFDATFSDGQLVQTANDRVGFDMIFQPVMPIQLTDDWSLITRPTIPVLFTESVPQPGGGFERKGTGLGDSQLPLLLADKNGIEIGDGQLLIGAGPTLGIPTGTSSAYSSKQWELGPAGVFVYQTKKLTGGVFPQYWWSYADRGGDQPSTSHGQLLYFFFYNLPEAWQVGTNPTITYDHQASSDDAWNVPIGITVAKTTQIGKQIVKFQFGIEYSVVSPDSYGKQVLIKLNIIPVVKSLIAEPLF